jgi:hypothetical protein
VVPSSSGPEVVEGSEGSEGSEDEVMLAVVEPDVVAMDVVESADVEVDAAADVVASLGPSSSLTPRSVKQAWQGRSARTRARRDSEGIVSSREHRAGFGTSARVTGAWVRCPSPTSS